MPTKAELRAEQHRKLPTAEKIWDRERMLQQRSEAAKKGWRSRKRMQAARKAK
jgi:hypothetical protein